MKVTRNEKAERKVLDKIKAWLNRRPRSQDKWHVSDLLYLRKAFFQRVDPQPMTDDQALYFIAGIGHHNILEAILGPKKKHARADAGEFEKHGIYFSPDLRLPFPLEIKTSRARKGPEEAGQKPVDFYEGYLKQLTAYQALMQDKIGALLVLFLAKLTGKGQRTKPAVRFYKVEMSPEERKKRLMSLVQSRKMLDAAVKNKKLFRKLPLCPEWMCRDCAWFRKCKPWLEEPKRKSLQKEAA